MNRLGHIEKYILPVLLVLPAAGFTAEVDPSILLCRDVQPAVRRAECYDQAVDHLLGNTARETAVIPSVTSQTPPAATVNPPPEAVTAESVFGKSQRETTRIFMQDRLGAEDLEALVGKVVNVSRDGLGRLTVVLDNNQTWVQTDTTELNLRSGEVIRISRGFMNSYQLEKQSGSRRIRVTRKD